MYGRSEYRHRAGMILACLWALVASVLFGGGMVSFVLANTSGGLIGSFLVWMVGLIVAGIGLEWWQR